MTRKLFLPGAGGSARFWQPVIERLPAAWDCHSFAWPGLGCEPHRQDVAGIDDLAEMVLAQLSTPADLVAQSMGGLVALKVALRSPEKVRPRLRAGFPSRLSAPRTGGPNIARNSRKPRRGSPRSAKTSRLVCRP